MAESLADKEWLRTGDVARVLGRSRESVVRGCHNGTFITAKQGDTSTGYNGQWLIHRDEVIEMANKKGQRSG